MMRRLAVGVLAAAILAGCGASTPAQPASSASGTASPTAAATVLTIGNSTEIDGLDPHIRVSSSTARVTGQIFQTLFQLKPDGSLEGVLATGYKNINPTTWEFTLRKGVSFQDGTPWNAQAFVDNIKRMFDPSLKSSVSSIIPTVLPDKIEVVNDYTVRVHTKIPDAVLPHRFAAYFVAFASPKVIDGHDAAYVAQHPVGTGPYEFVEWKKDDHLTLKAWSGYWGPKPTISELIFKPMPDAQSRVSALLSGDIQMAMDLPTESIAQVNQNASTTVVTAPEATRTFLLYLDGRHGGPLADPRVRLALNYAVDRQTILTKLLDGQGVPIESIVSPQSFGYDKSLQPYPYDPAKAKSLLAQAGYGGGFTTNLHYPPGTYTNDGEVVQAIQSNFAQIGVNVKLVPEEFTVYLSKTLTGKQDGMFFSGKTNLTLDADYIFTDSAPGSPFGQYNPLSGQALSLWHQEQQAFDETQRANLAQQVQQILYQAPNWVYLYEMNQIYGVSKQVQHWTPRVDSLLDFGGVSLAGK